MPLSWNEIRDRALSFSKEWEGESSESAEAHSFWDAFFQVFGVSRRRLASFEAPVKQPTGGTGFIDLLWKGVLVVEHKSLGKDLDRAFRQAVDYFPGMKDRDLPQYVLVSDFARFRLYDLEGGEQHEFPLSDLHREISLFGFVAGYQSRSFGQDDPVNVHAVQRLGRLHDELAATGYTGHSLEVFLVRLLFCMFAEDTAVFERKEFQDYIEQRTSEDGADLGSRLAHLCQVLDTPPEKRASTLDEQLMSFPYVNGRLFEEQLPIPSFNTSMREALLECCALDWSRISPAIFGSLFQFIMVADRRRLGAHYTSETNILKALRPLFLDGLHAEFEKIRRSRSAAALENFHHELSRIRILDPACGCGNFLVVAYRELRLLELDLLRILLRDKQQKGLLYLDTVEFAVQVDVDQFYGIEIEEFPAQIAQAALWLTDHQMNLLVSEEFGQSYRRLPLKKAPNVVKSNALTMDWPELIDPQALSYIVGNPPFAGARMMDGAQRDDVALVFDGVKNRGLLDYVACWYRKAAELMKRNPLIQTAFVSTNSITQGEQAGALWTFLLAQGVHINFAHRTFRWGSEAPGKAAVHCVIIGFALIDRPAKRLFEYETVESEPHEIVAKHINPYLVDAPDLVLSGRSKQLCDVPGMRSGNQPIDNRNFLFLTDERDEFIEKEPASSDYFRRWLGADEFLNGYERWCLWLGDCPPSELRKMPEAMRRIEAVRSFRAASSRKSTQLLADRPARFQVETMPESDYLVVPEVSSERRYYIPMGYEPPETLASNLLKVVSGATPYHFGILQSLMHMAWVRAVCGRLESRYRYSVGIVYNNFPWPESPPAGKVRAVEKAANGVLEARTGYRDATLADLYDPLTMPDPLRKAHRALDQAVDAAYGKSRLRTEADRVAYLFEFYSKLTNAG